MCRRSHRENKKETQDNNSKKIKKTVPFPSLLSKNPKFALIKKTKRQTAFSSRIKSTTEMK
jgi:hypothetical protein